MPPGEHLMFSNLLSGSSIARLTLPLAITTQILGWIYYTTGFYLKNLPHICLKKAQYFVVLLTILVFYLILIMC